MKILKSWLKEYIDIDLSDTDLAEKLSLSGSSVEEIVYGIDKKVIVVEIKKIESHPNADRLRLATVFDGEKEMTVVCGAPNIEVGQKVPLAQLGAVLPGNFEIKKALIRGVESEGMLCAADELGLGEDHSGIIILPDDYILGTPYSEYLESDAIFDIETTANRGDCLSHLGIAREVSALLQKPLQNNDLTSQQINELTDLKINIEASDLCPQYFALQIEDVKVGPSPDWLKIKIEAMGGSSINNIVDITNYILFDLGQPLHAFDRDKITGDEIIIRRSAKLEKIATLDGSDRLLDEEMLLIADKEKPLALAGIMGGKDSEVTEKTTSILLESAEFDRRSIRKTAKVLNLSSEASYRFERGIDSGGVKAALLKAASLITELSGGKIKGLISSGKHREQAKIEIDYEKINSLTGHDFEKEEIGQILTSLGFLIDGNDAIVPLWRHDVALWQDLAEEVARIYGYNNIERQELASVKAPKKSSYFAKEKIKDILVEKGFSEIFGYTFLSANDAKAIDLPTDGLLEVANPIQPENKYLRNSITPGLLRAIAKNPTFDPVLIFEIGHVFDQASENINLAIAAAGKGANKAIKKAVDEIAGFAKIDSSNFALRQLSQTEADRFKIRKGETWITEIGIAKLLENTISDDELKLTVTDKEIFYRPVSKFPSLTRDLAFIVDAKIDTEKIKEAIYSISDQINRVELFDEFASDKFGQNKKNVAYHIYLQHLDRTMTDAEADKIIEAVTSKIKAEFAGELRQF
jgi:phenylalanyl-tRNA synthetase beta chain